MVYHYSLYGLRLKSHTAIDGLPPLGAQQSGSELDCFEIDGAGSRLRVPAPRSRKLVYSSRQLNHDSATFRVYQWNEATVFQLCYQDGARFIVDEQARWIGIDGPPELTPEDLATYLVGPVMGFVLRRRGVLALHASCFSFAGGAFALCGRPGAGKSTTAAALALRGVPILCEDVTALYERDAAFHVAPGYPRINLWPESVAILFPCALDLPRITPNWQKRYFALDGSQARFDPAQRPLAALYILDARSDDTTAPAFEDLSPREAALCLVENTYMNYLLEKPQRAAEFDAITRLVSSTRVKRVTPSSDPGKIHALCQALERDAALVAASRETASSGSLP